MNFSMVMDKLLNKSEQELSDELGVSLDTIREWENTNEVPFPSIRQMSSLYSIPVGEIIHFDFGDEKTDHQKKLQEMDSQLSSFHIINKEVVTNAFNIWLDENIDVLKLSTEMNDWINNEVISILEAYEKTQKGEIEDEQLRVEEKDAIEFLGSLDKTVQKEIERIDFLINNKTKCQDVVKSALNHEPTRLIKEDQLFEKIGNEADQLPESYFNKYAEQLNEIFSVEYIEDITKATGKKIKDLKDEDFSVLFTVSEKYFEDNLNEFISELDKLIKTNSDSYFVFFKNEIKEMFKDAPEVIGFDIEDEYEITLSLALQNPEIFDYEQYKPTEEEELNREKAHKKRLRREAVGSFFTGLLFPPSAIIDVVTARHRFAKSLYKHYMDYKITDDYLIDFAWRMQFVSHCMMVAAMNVGDQWKEYFDNTLQLVNRSDRDIQSVRQGESKKQLIIAKVVDAIKEVK